MESTKLLLDSLLDTVDANEDDFIAELKDFSSNVKIEELFENSQFPNWERVFSVLDKNWPLAHAALSSMLEKIIKQIPSSFKLLIVRHFSVAMSNEAFGVRNIFVQSLDDLTTSDYQQFLIPIIKKTLPQVISYYAKDPYCLASAVLTILKYSLNTPELLTLIADNLNEPLESLPRNAALRKVHLCALLAVKSKSLSSILAQNGALKKFIDLYSLCHDDILSQTCLLEDFSSLAESSVESCAIFYGSSLIDSLWAVLGDMSHDMFYRAISFFTRVYSLTLPLPFKKVSELINVCLGIEINPTNWLLIYVSFQSCVYLLTNEDILIDVFTNNSEQFNRITHYFNQISLNLPTHSKGDYYEIFSRIFLDVPANDATIIPLKLLFDSMLTAKKVVGLVRSISYDTQKAGLLLTHGVGRHSWSTDYFNESNEGIIATLADPQVRMVNSETLHARNNAIRLFLTSPLYADKISDVNKIKLNNIMNMRSSATIVPRVGLENS